jgi:ribonuclease HI
MLNIVAHTDGACLGNPGVGGFAAVMRAKNKKKICQGYDKNPKATNNKMELRAVICVIDWCNEIQKEPCEIEIRTDSQYLVDTSKHSIKSLTSSARPNNELWLELIKKAHDGGHHITFVKVPGHSGNEDNEEADKLAKAQARRARHELYGC